MPSNLIVEIPGRGRYLNLAIIRPDKGFGVMRRFHRYIYHPFLISYYIDSWVAWLALVLRILFLLNHLVSFMAFSLPITGICSFTRRQAFDYPRVDTAVDKTNSFA